MSARKIYGPGFVALALLIMLAGGCNGVLYEKQQDNGMVERLTIQQDKGWDDLNITPRNWNQSPKDQSDYGLMLKDEYTF